MTEDLICITTDCERPQKTRGLCKNCYAIGTNMIKAGEVPSWDFLVEHGMALIPNQTPRNRGLFRVKLNEKLHEISRKTAKQILQNGKHK